MNMLNKLVENALKGFYPGIVFDAAGLTGMLVPCLLVVLAALAVGIVLRLLPDVRRFAHVPVVVALIAMIAASAFFPVTLTQAGHFAVNQISQHMEQPEENHGMGQ